MTRCLLASMSLPMVAVWLLVVTACQSMTSAEKRMHYWKQQEPIVARAHELLELRFDEEQWSGLNEGRPYQIVRLAERLTSDVRRPSAKFQSLKESERSSVFAAVELLYEKADRLGHPLAMRLLAEFALNHYDDMRRVYSILERSRSSEVAEIVLVMLGLGRQRAVEIWGEEQVATVMGGKGAARSGWWALASLAPRMDLAEASKRLDSAFRFGAGERNIKWMRSEAFLLTLVGDRDPVLKKYYSENGVRIGENWYLKYQEESKLEREEAKLERATDK